MQKNVSESNSDTFFMGIHQKMQRRAVYSGKRRKEAAFMYEEDRIELFLSDRGNRFVRGYWHGPEGERQELDCYVHLGMFTDSCLIYPAHEWDGMALCRYFPREYGVEFYDTLYKQQDYSTPLHIHNTGNDPLQVRFQFFDACWTIPPGENRVILPYCNKGADKPN